MNKPLLVLLLTSALYLPVVQACEQFTDNEAEQLLTILKNTNNKSADTESYQFSVDYCENNKNRGGEYLASNYRPKENSKSMFHHPNKSNPNYH